jgi:hypothetical protein
LVVWLVGGFASCASLSGLTGGAEGGKEADASAGDATSDARRVPREAGPVDATHPDARPADAGPPDASLTDAGHSDGSTTHDAGGQSDAELDGACTHAAPVGPPAQVSAGAKTVSFAAALSAYTSGVTTAFDGGATGFDLDRQCTCPGPPSCVSSSMAANCDVEPGGHDIVGNALGSLLDSELAGTAEGDLNTRIMTGRYNLVLDVQNYNGGANDSEVFVAILTSSGLGGDAGTPKFDGTDVWNIDPASTLGPVEGDAGAYTYTPRYSVSDAYVNDHVLVARFPEVVVGLSFGTVTLSGAIVSAQIETTPSGSYRLEGQIAARISTLSIFGLLGHLSYDDGDGGSHKLCGSDPVFQAAQQSVCATTDIMSQPSQDGTDAGCNALSFAIGLQAVEAVLGPPVATHYPVAGCDGGVVDCP